MGPMSGKENQSEKYTGVGNCESRVWTTSSMTIKSSSAPRAWVNLRAMCVLDLARIPFASSARAAYKCILVASQKRRSLIGG